LQQLLARNTNLGAKLQTLQQVNERQPRQSGALRRPTADARAPLIPPPPAKR
jgi:hypothetical protein